MFSDETTKIDVLSVFMCTFFFSVSSLFLLSAGGKRIPRTACVRKINQKKSPFTLLDPSAHIL